MCLKGLCLAKFIFGRHSQLRTIRTYSMHLYVRPGPLGLFSRSSHPSISSLTERRELSHFENLELSVPNQTARNAPKADPRFKLHRGRYAVAEISNPLFHRSVDFFRR